MASAHISVDPFTLAEVLTLAAEEGFTVEVTHQREGVTTMINLIHEDGRGCHEMSEEESVYGNTHIGCMGDPQMDGMPMSGEGEDDYSDLCGCEDDDDDED